MRDPHFRWQAGSSLPCQSFQRMWVSGFDFDQSHVLWKTGLQLEVWKDFVFGLQPPHPPLSPSNRVNFFESAQLARLSFILTVMYICCTLHIPAHMKYIPQRMLQILKNTLHILAKYVNRILGLIWPLQTSNQILHPPGKVSFPILAQIKSLVELRM